MEDFGSKAYGAVAVLADVPGAPQVDGVLTANETHYLVLWFAPVLGGAREVVAIEMTPRPAGEVTGKALGVLKRQWLYPAAQRLAKAMPEHVTGVSQADVRGIPLRAAQTLRSQQLAASELSKVTDLKKLIGQATSLDGVEAREFQRLEMLQDAVDYVHSVSVGISPTALVALRRGITRPAAEQRIVRARMVGFLTPGDSNRVGGDLTATASDLLARVEAATRSGRRSRRAGG